MTKSRYSPDYDNDWQWIRWHDWSKKMNEKHEDRMEVKFCGMVLGSASGWDQWVDEVIHFYEFLSGRPEFPDSNSLDIDSSNGVLTFYDSDGTPIKEFMISLGFNPI